MTGEQLKAIIAERMERDPRLRRIRARTAKGKATKADSFQYSRICSEIMSEELAKAVLDLDDREGICAALLRGNYEEIMQTADAIQRSIDEKQRIHMQPRRPAFPAERVQQIAHSLVDPTVPEETIRRRAGSTATVSMSFHDDFVQENAAFRARAGLKCWITRETDGSCCRWCSALAGRYVYGEEPQDVYRRHDNCCCTVTYENGRKRQDVWSKRTWEAPAAGAGAKEPARLTTEQAAAKEAEHLPKRLTPDAGSGTIPLGAIFTRAMQPNRRIGADGQQVIDKPTLNKLMRKFLRHGGIIRDDEEAVRHLQERPEPAYAAYLPGFNVILLTPEPTISDVLEETYHAEQDRLHMFGEQVTPEVLLRREIDAQHYLLSMTERYKIPAAEVEVTRANLKKYERDLEELLRLQGGEQNV